MVNAPSDAARQHCEGEAAEALQSRVAQALAALGPGPVTAAQLAGLDQFHVGGLAATAELAELAGIRRGSDVLDAGSGLGGPSRYLAGAYGCSVVGLDLAPSFVAVAGLLAERAGLGGRVAYRVGDLLALPFADASFDIVWTQHAVINIRDRDQAYREFRRVLRPGGRLAFHDVLAEDGQPAPHFPVPWAESAEASTLLTEAETTEALLRAGFKPGVWKDVTAAAVAGFGQQRPPPSPGLSLAADGAALRGHGCEPRPQPSRGPRLPRHGRLRSGAARILNAGGPCVPPCVAFLAQLEPEKPT